MATETFNQDLSDLQKLLDNLCQETDIQLIEKGNLQEGIFQSISLLHTILENNPAGMAIVSGPELVFRLATPAYRAIVPSQPERMTGKPYSEIWPPEQGFDGSQLIRQIMEEGKNKHFDRLELRYPDGLIHSFSMRLCRINWQNEPGALILIQETTQADRARQLAMEIAEEAYRQADEIDAVIRSMVEVVTIFDPNGRVLKANGAASDFYGIDPVGMDQAELRDLLAARHPDGSPMDAGELPSARALAGEKVIGQRLLLTDSTGQERVVRISASPLMNSTGLTGVVTVWHDVTERERLLEQLEIEQSRLETIIENAPEAIMVLDEEGRLMLANPAAEQIFGRVLPYEENYQSQSILSICYDDGTPYDPRNLPLVCSALDGGHTSNIELLVRLPDGRSRYLLASTAPIVDRKGNLNGAVGVFQDNTERKQVEENLRRQAARSQLLDSLSRAFSEAGLNHQDLIETIVRQVCGVFGELCILHLFGDDGRQYYPAAVYHNDPLKQEALKRTASSLRFRADEGLAGMVYRSGQPQVLESTPVEAMEEFYTAAFHSPISLHQLAVPLRAHARWIGVLIVVRGQQSDPYLPDDLAFLQDLADRAALAIDDALLFERESQRARELQALHRAAAALLSTIDLETLLEQILDSAHQAIPAAEQGVLYFTTDETGRLEIRASFNCSDLNVLYSSIHQVAERCAVEKVPQVIDEINPAQSTWAGPVHSAITAPLVLAQKALGVLVLFGPHPGLFNGNDVRLLTSFAATATAALQNATLYAEVQRLAITDTLTEQYNRRKFLELGELEMHRFRRFKTPLSAIMFDLDRFKDINDTFGHSSGDQVLQAVARRCYSSIRVIDILGRYGGDEFAILLPNADILEAHEIAERIRQAVTGTAVNTSQGELHISISLGVAQAVGDIDSLSALLNRADAALYKAKQSGRDRVAYG